MAADTIVLAFALVALLTFAGLRIRRAWLVQRNLDVIVATGHKETARERARADSYVTRIDGIVREATEARALYIRSSAEHAAAQALLLREIDSLCQQFRNLATLYTRETGKAPPRAEPKVNPVVRTVAAVYHGEHVAPHANAPAPQPIAAPIA